MLDEKLGVRIARDQGLAVTGTLGVLVQAARRGLINIDVQLPVIAQSMVAPCSAPSRLVAALRPLCGCGLDRACAQIRMAGAR
jgi:predicted nucleic acid-binding protein